MSLLSGLATMGKRFTCLAAAATFSLLLTSCTSNNDAIVDTQTQNIRIAAAANLSDVLPQIIVGYEASLADNNLAEVEIDVTYASSGKLYAQIIAGAPYDIFLSANQDFPAALIKDNATYSAPFTYTQGQLALYSTTQPVNNLNAKTLAALLSARSTSKITIANPELAPFGEAAKAYLQSQNIYESLVAQKRLIQAENIGQAFQYAHTGSVDYGFVAQSQLIAIDARINDGAKQFYTLPVEDYPAILQDGVVISDAIAATDFANYLQSAVGQRYFTQAGYLAVQ